ncbi:hypothetical protein T439DRAFT_358309 [Meredithblackwellia eburnea MCA 4105]
MSLNTQYNVPDYAAYERKRERRLESSDKLYGEMEKLKKELKDKMDTLDKLRKEIDDLEERLDSKENEHNIALFHYGIACGEVGMVHLILQQKGNNPATAAAPRSQPEVKSSHPASGAALEVDSEVPPPHSIKSKGGSQCRT